MATCSSKEWFSTLLWAPLLSRMMWKEFDCCCFGPYMSSRFWVCFKPHMCSTFFNSVTYPPAVWYGNRQSDIHYLVRKSLSEVSLYPWPFNKVLDIRHQQVGCPCWSPHQGQVQQHCANVCSLWQLRRCHRGVVTSGARHWNLYTAESGHSPLGFFCFWVPGKVVPKLSLFLFVLRLCLLWMLWNLGTDLLQAQQALTQGLWGYGCPSRSNQQRPSQWHLWILPTYGDVNLDNVSHWLWKNNDQIEAEAMWKWLSAWSWPTPTWTKSWSLDRYQP